MNEKQNKSKADILPKIFSVLAAVILWFYVVDLRTTTDEITVYGVPISINNFSENDGLDIVSGKDFTVDVEVRGNKSELGMVSAQDIYASVDMNGVDRAGTHKLDVDVVSLKKGVTVVNKSVSRISVTVDKNASAVVPIELVMLYTIEEDVYEMKSPVMSFESVQITGPQNIVDTVVKAKVEMNIGKVENTITYTGKLKLYDSSENEVQSPYIKLSEDVVKVEIPVYKTQKKNVVPVFYDTSYEYDYTVSPSSVYLKGSVSSIENIKNAATEPITETSPKLFVKRLDLPAGVTAYDDKGNVVDTVKVNVLSAEDKNSTKKDNENDK